MTAQLLIASLRTQEANLIKLNNALQMQKEAIIKNSLEDLEKSIQEEQKIIQIVEREENLRLKLVQDIAKQFNLELPNNSLDSLLKEGEIHFQKDIKELNLLRNSLKMKASSLKNTNAQLKDVIEFSRNLIKETLMMIAGSSKRALVNKRV